MVGAQRAVPLLPPDNSLTPKLDIQQLSVTFEQNGQPVHALRDVTFQVMAGEFVILIGPSGSGKSTLFNVITGLLTPTSGSAFIDGNPVQPGISQVGYMPQKDLLLPWRTVIDNVIIPLEIAGTERAQAHQRAKEMLPLFGLEDFASVYPDTLSGGMRQRAALLRTVLTDRDIIVLDEPFGALDALTRRELQDWLLGIWREFKQTILFVTHDVEEAVYLGDRVLVLSERPGHVAAEIDVNLPRPRRHNMVADPTFGKLEAELLQALGIEV